MAKLFAKLNESNVVMSRILLDDAHCATEAKGIEWLEIIMVILIGKNVLETVV